MDRSGQKEVYVLCPAAAQRAAVQPPRTGCASGGRQLVFEGTVRLGRLSFALGRGDYALAHTGLRGIRLYASATRRAAARQPQGLFATARRCVAHSPARACAAHADTHRRLGAAGYQRRRTTGDVLSTVICDGAVSVRLRFTALTQSVECARLHAGAWLLLMFNSLPMSSQ